MSMKRWWFVPAVLVVLASMASGCSVFRGSRRMDMSPFAENTSMMFAEAAKVSRPFRAIYLRPYLNIPEVQEFRDKGAPVVRGLRSLVLYSNQVVGLNNSTKSEHEKNRLLADYLDEAAGSVATREKLESLGFSSRMLDSTLVAIRSAHKFLDGVNAASPLINVVGLALLDKLDELNADFPRLINAIDAGIEHQYREKRAAYEGLTRLQARYLLAATWLYRGKSGDPTAVDSLLRIDPSMRSFIPSARQVTLQQFDGAEGELVGRLERLSTLIEQMDTERTTYNATQQELMDLRLNLDQRIKVARDAVVVWGQSHRNLGIGVSVPPLVNLSAIASGVAHSVPVP